MSTGIAGQRILIMAAGTGGHIFPALQVAKALQKRGCEIRWLGSGRALEKKLVVDYRLHSVRARGYFGKGILSKLAALLNNALALLQCLWLMLWRRPRAVVGFGGYICVPGALAALLLRVPVFLHEQNAIAGRANRLFVRYARVAFEGLQGAFGDCAHALHTGNPVGAQIIALPDPEKRYAQRDEKGLHILILGGSQGAGDLNDAVPEALARMDGGLHIWHQAGAQHVEQVEAQYRQRQLSARVDAFIDDMASAYGWADLVVSRAGAMVLSEMSACGVAALLVPYPHAVDNHQLLNAKKFSPPAVMAQTQDEIAQQLSRLLSSREALCNMGKAMRELAKPRATKHIVDALQECLA